tara:strand:+ start:13740 stop:14990 length:1251 start_codon:yes stop_codon:yes gene_type:complete
MNRKFILILNLFLSIVLTAQNNQISLNTGYTNQSFYSIENGETLNISNEDWDIAFSTESISSTIRTNDGKGVELYTYQLGDTSAWNSINNNDINNLTKLMFNADTSWEYGAFDINQTGGFDYGWGIYNLQTHHLLGDSIFIIKTINGNWKKLWVKSKILGEYHIKYADLDGNNTTDITIPASNYSDKNFVYYSLDNNLILDREPNKNSWDITFAKYMTLYPTQQGTFMPYSVTGALHNLAVTVAQADNISSPLTYNNYTTHSFANTINTIGFDWKIFQGSYIIVNNRCYFIRDKANNIWRLTFTNFDGTSTGNIEFNTELIGSTNLEELESINNFSIFPNPVSNTESITLIYELKNHNSNAILKIHDITGREIYQSILTKGGLQEMQISTSELNKGLYLISININGEKKTDRIIVN